MCFTSLKVGPVETLPEEDFYELERLRKKALEESEDDASRRRDYTRMELEPGLGIPTLTPRWHDDKKD